MGRGKGRAYMPKTSDYSGEGYKPASMMAEDADMTDANSGVALHEAARNGSATGEQPMGEGTDIAFGISSHQDALMNSFQMGVRPSPFQKSKSTKTVTGTSDQADDITTKGEPSSIDSAMQNEVAASHDAQQWHQLPPDAMKGSEELWQPPQPISSKTTNETAQKYRKFCDEIEARWDCTVLDAMPLHLRASTPYSLTMLLHLHRLAALSRKDMIGAHAGLDVARSSRLSGAVPQSGEARIEWTENADSKQERVQKYAEARIWENTNGLMLVDVRKACRSVNEAKRSQKKSAAEDAMDVTRTRSKKAEKRARYKANKATKKHEARLRNKIDKRDDRQLARALDGLLNDKKSEVPESKRNAVERGFKLPSERFNPTGLPSLGSSVQGQVSPGSTEGEMEGLE